LSRIVHVAGERGDVPAVSSLVSWQTHPADLRASLTHAVGMADYLHGVHGAVTSVGSSAWGTPNGIVVVSGYDSIADFEAASNAVQAEGTFLDRMESAVGIAESIQSWVMRRIT